MPFLSQDPLYALHESAIDAVLEHIPTFFTAAQQDFERDLARTSRHGFFLRRPIVGPGGGPFSQPTADQTPGLPIPLAGDVESLRRTPGLTIGQFLEQKEVLPRVTDEGQDRLAPILSPEWFVSGKTQEIVAAIERMIAKLREAAGRPTLEVREAMRQERQEKELFQRKKEAYAGWLLADPTYRREVRTLREQWEETVAELGGFPSLREESGEETGATPHPEQAACAGALRAFCHRWCLQGLLTWDIPLPLNAAMDAVLDAPRHLAPGEGVAVELPWPLLSGSQIDVRAVLRRLRFEWVPEHLRGWVCQENSGLAAEVTCHHFFGLYRLLNLVLLRRYAPACRGRIEKLELACADILHRTPELVHRVRQKLARKLRET
jgi:hypothetical protein